MARDKMTYDSYERDIFDNPPKGPVGVHRGPRPVMARIAPFLIVILVAALCGVGAWLVVSGEYKVILGQENTSQVASGDSSSKSDAADASSDGTDGSTANKDSSSSDTSTDGTGSSDANQSGQSDSADSTNADANADQNAQQSQPASTVNKATQVLVINATGIQGYAGQKSDVLQTSGYTSVSASNPSGGTLPGYTVVWYQNETDKATAEDVASTLGISAVEQVQGLSTPITVVLLN